MYDLQRFIDAQRATHAKAVQELQAGEKCSHWSWWEIPQIVGLGITPTSEKYAILNIEEARAYLKDPTLLSHLLEICNALLSLTNNDAEAVMGYPDNLKLRSCMTLFHQADPSIPEFKAVLDKFFGSKPDWRTTKILLEQTV